MAASDFGPQYAGDDDFKARARVHPSRFRFEELELREYRNYGNRLTSRDALAGKNFYSEWPGLVEAVDARYGRKDSPVWYDMLRSEHIPFNLFVPMRDQLWARQLFGAWLGFERAGYSSASSFRPIVDSPRSSPIRATAAACSTVRDRVRLPDARDSSVSSWSSGGRRTAFFRHLVSGRVG